MDSSLRKYTPTLYLLARILAASVVVLVILAVAASFVLDSYGSKRLAEAHALARSRNLPLSIAEYEASLPPLADEDNAANVYRRAFAMIEAKGYSSDYVPFVFRRPSSREPEKVDAYKKLELIFRDPRAPMSEDILTASKRFLEDRREALSLITRAQSLKEARYGTIMEPGEVCAPGARLSARCLALAAIVAAEERDSAAALARLSEGLTMARSTMKGPNGGYFVTAPAISTLLGGLERTLSRSEVSDPELETLQTLAGNTARELTMAEDSKANLCMLCDVYRAVMERRIPIQALLRTYVRSLDEPRPLPDRNSFPVRGLVWLGRGYLKADQALLIRLCVALFDYDVGTATSLPEAGSPLYTEIMNSWCLGARMAMLTDYSREFDRGFLESARTRLKAAEAGIAALRYRNDTGAWPKDLQALVPDYCSAVPEDPLSGNPLLYAVMPEGIVVYSVGQNRLDEGGKGYALPPDEGNPTGADDIGIRVWR